MRPRFNTTPHACSVSRPLVWLEQPARKIRAAPPVVDHVHENTSNDYRLGNAAGAVRARKSGSRHRTRFRAFPMELLRESEAPGFRRTNCRARLLRLLVCAV